MDTKVTDLGDRRFILAVEGDNNSQVIILQSKIVVSWANKQTISISYDKEQFVQLFKKAVEFVESLP